MSTKSGNDSKEKYALSKLKWSVIGFLIIVAIVGNEYFSHLQVWARALACCAVVGVCLIIALRTNQGNAILAFGKDSRAELRKVVWPTRVETQQTAFVVVGIVVITALALWAMDSFLVWAIGLLAGNGV